MGFSRARLAAVAALVAVTAGGVMLARDDRTPTARPAPSSSVLPEAFKPTQMLCFFSHRNFDDAIVAPGIKDATHQHDYVANETTDYRSKYDDDPATVYNEGLIMRPTSCAPDEPKDTAAAWFPSRWVNGVAQPLNPGARLYYSRPQTVQGVVVGQIDQAFPPDFRMIAGNSAAMTPEQNPLVVAERLFFFCYPEKRTVPGEPPMQDCKSTLDAAGKGGRMDMYLTFPSCWVYKTGPAEWRRNALGEIIDSTNHRDHVTWPGKTGCPASHPRRLPQVKMQIIYQAYDGPTVFSCGPWWCAHADYINSWDQERLEQIVALANAGA